MSATLENLKNKLISLEISGIDLSEVYIHDSNGEIMKNIDITVYKPNELYMYTELIEY